MSPIYRPRIWIPKSVIYQLSEESEDGVGREEFSSLFFIVGTTPRYRMLAYPTVPVIGWVFVGLMGFLLVLFVYSYYLARQ